MRINKFISESGLCSRREADKLLSKGAFFNPADATGMSTLTTKFCWTPICPLDTTDGTFIDFILYDDRNDFRNLAATAPSINRWSAVIVKFIDLINLKPVSVGTGLSVILYIPKIATSG